MPVRVVCPHCKQALRLPDRLYHEPAGCPHCAGAFEVRWPRRPMSEEVLDALPVQSEDNAPRRPCPTCGKSIHREARKCPYCRDWVDTEK